MEQVNLGSVIEQAITRSSQNRLGEKPPVFVALAPVLPQIPWRDAALRRFLQSFLYESLLTSDANAPVEISLRKSAIAAKSGLASRAPTPAWVFLGPLTGPI